MKVETTLQTDINTHDAVLESPKAGRANRVDSTRNAHHWKDGQNARLILTNNKWIGESLFAHFVEKTSFFCPQSVYIS